MNMTKVVVNRGSARQSIVSSISPRFEWNAEKPLSASFKYTTFRGKDFTFGQNSLERYSKMLRQRNAIRDQLEEHCRTTGKFSNISNTELKKSVMDQQ
jgi:hypothetical protein